MSQILKQNEIVFETDREGQKLIFKSGMLAPLTDASVLVSLGETSLLANCVMEKRPDPNKDFLPLTIDFKETFYAGGKIGGAAYTRREGKPSDNAVLTSRLTDRPIRPMFPSGMVNDTIISILALSMDKQNHPGVISIISASLSIMLAGIPFEGPVGAARIGYIDGKFIVNPSHEQLEISELDLLLAGSKDTITMVECGANEIDTEILMQAFEIGQQQIQKVCEFQEEFLKKFEITPKEITANIPGEKLLEDVAQAITKAEFDSIYPADKKTVQKFEADKKKLLMEKYAQELKNEENSDITKQKIDIAVFKTIKKYVRENILRNGQRIDGRQLDQVRPLFTMAGLVPRVHGTGLFQRGETQVLSFTTLGAPGDVLLIDDMENDTKEERFIHHYNMPPFSTGEARSSRAPSRREIGHGKLAEKALSKVIPDEETFPYAIRVVSEVLSCNGSTSMASVCASCLSLMDAGVPLKAPVSGIAMGLVSDENLNYKVLTDIQGLEDFTGDMDFKVAGTPKGITALQMDMKIKGLKLEIIKEAISKANIGRKSILEHMLSTLPEPRKDTSPYAPRIIIYKVDPSQIREVIGPGGSVINEIIKETGVKIDFKDDGTCMITSKDETSGQKALDIIKGIVRTPKEGDIIEGTICRVETYGVFVSLNKNKQGLCHVKNLGTGFIQDAKTMFKEGDKLKVKIMGVDKDGKIQLKKEI